MSVQNKIQFVMAVRLHEAHDAIEEEKSEGYHIINLGAFEKDNEVIMLFLMSNDTNIFRCIAWVPEKLLEPKTTITPAAFMLDVSNKDILDICAPYAQFLLDHESQYSPEQMAEILRLHGVKAEQFRNDPSTWK